MVTKYGTLELRNSGESASDGNAGGVRAENAVNNSVNSAASGRGSPDKSNSQKLLLTWMINDVRLFKTLEEIIGEEDFFDEDIRPVAHELFTQYKETGTVRPASILNMYDDVEKQRLVASIMQTELPFEMDDDEKEKAINDLVKKTKLGFIDWKLPQCTNDAKQFQELVIMKAKISKLHISLNNG